MKHQTALPQLRVNLSEIFRSIQGEGCRIGRTSVFVRFSNCNLRCSWLNPDGSRSRCDTPYTSFEPERKMVLLEDVCSQMDDMLRPQDDIVVTGGEPLLWAEAVAAISSRYARHQLTIETNGTQSMTLQSRSLLYSVSPKLQNSNTQCDLNAVAANINAIRVSDVQLKFVCSMPDDIFEIESFLARIRIPAQVYLMPQGATVREIEERAAWVADAAVRMNVNYSDRLHIRLWSGRRGV